MFRTIARALFIATLSAAASACHAQALPPGAAAEVEGYLVPRAEVTDRLLREFGTPLIDRLVNQQIVRLEAKRRGISATAKEIDAEVAGLKARYFQLPDGEAQWSAFLKRYSTANLRKDLEITVLSRKIGRQEAAAAKLSAAEVAAVRQQVKREATRYRVRQVMVGIGPDYGGRTQQDALTRANEALEKLKAGGTWQEVAREYSDDALTKEAGGEAEPFSPGQYSSAFEEAVTKLAPNTMTTAPVLTNQGYHIIGLLEKTVSPVTEVDVQKALSAALQQKRQVLSDINGMAWFAKIRDRYPVLVKYPWQTGTP